jgi:hypothetical protein
VEKGQVYLALGRDLIKLIDKRGGRASRSAEGEYLIKLGYATRKPTRQRGGETVMGFQFKPKLSAVLTLLNGASVGLAYIVSQGNRKATIIWLAITTGATAGLSAREKTIVTSSRIR